MQSSMAGSFSVAGGLLTNLLDIFYLIDDSSFEVLQPATPRCSGDDSFQNQVLSILHNLRQDFHIMSNHVTKLEDHRMRHKVSTVNCPNLRGMAGLLGIAHHGSTLIPARSLTSPSYPVGMRRRKTIRK